jgi:type II secretory pathway component PulM
VAQPRLFKLLLLLALLLLLLLVCCTLQHPALEATKHWRTILSLLLLLLLLPCFGCISKLYLV